MIVAEVAETVAHLMRNPPEAGVMVVAFCSACETGLAAEDMDRLACPHCGPFCKGRDFVTRLANKN